MMKKRALSTTGLIIVVVFLIGISSTATAQNPACTLPVAISPSASPQQIAWQLFVAANCPTTGKLGPLTWENWTEQTCWQSSTPPPGCPVTGGLTAVASKRFLHGSQLRAMTMSAKKPGIAAQSN
ncbi:MAG: hypothetical protein ACRD3J_25075, partial [Thermoanaerobaculia bacterium]